LKVAFSLEEVFSFAVAAATVAAAAAFGFADFFPAFFLGEGDGERAGLGERDGDIEGDAAGGGGGGTAAFRRGRPRFFVSPTSPFSSFAAAAFVATGAFLLGAMD
jgi:hypothetical protein